MHRRYQAQVTLLTSLLRPIYGLGLEIGTVDGMQGREKDAVVISLVRSNEKVRVLCFLFVKPATNTGSERGRLSERQKKTKRYGISHYILVIIADVDGIEVAMTRAKRHLVCCFNEIVVRLNRLNCILVHCRRLGYG